MHASPLDETHASAPSARLLDGKYELLRCLGKGGMGEVWEAAHAKLGHHVAIKFIHAEAAQDRDLLRRFCNEARASAKLQSRFIVQVLDDGVAADARPYIVMEKLIGESLGDRLARVGRLEPEAVRLVLRDVCRGLAVAHDAGIVHRDLKPDNIFLHRGPDDDHETAKLVDFGIARLTDAADAGPSLTQTGSLLGTPVYMSPEQTRGAKPIDLRADLWALGVIAHECLTGEIPFEARALVDLFMQICIEPQAPLSSRRPELPPALDAWMAQALAKDKRQRFMTASELLAAYERALGHEPAASVSFERSLERSFDHSAERRPAPAGVERPARSSLEPEPTSDSPVARDAPAPGWRARSTAPRLVTLLVLAAASSLLLLALLRGSWPADPPAALPAAPPAPAAARAPAAASLAATQPPVASASPPASPLAPPLADELAPTPAAAASSLAAASPARKGKGRRVVPRGNGQDDLGY